MASGGKGLWSNDVAMTYSNMPARLTARQKKPRIAKLADFSG
jgi:hypothetical protein